MSVDPVIELFLPLRNLVQQQPNLDLSCSACGAGSAFVAAVEG